jgi:hypothetical protein
MAGAMMSATIAMPMLTTENVASPWFPGRAPSASQTKQRSSAIVSTTNTASQTTADAMAMTRSARYRLDRPGMPRK